MNSNIPVNKWVLIKHIRLFWKAKNKWPRNAEIFKIFVSICCCFLYNSHSGWGKMKSYSGVTFLGKDSESTHNGDT